MGSRWPSVCRRPSRTRASQNGSLDAHRRLWSVDVAAAGEQACQGPGKPRPHCVPAIAGGPERLNEKEIIITPPRGPARRPGLRAGRPPASPSLAPPRTPARSKGRPKVRELRRGAPALLRKSQTCGAWVPRCAFHPTTHTPEIGGAGDPNPNTQESPLFRPRAPSPTFQKMSRRVKVPTFGASRQLGSPYLSKRCTPPAPRRVQV